MSKFLDSIGLRNVLEHLFAVFVELDGTYTSNLNSGLASKQDTISDLAAIRSGAAAGAAAVQPSALANYETALHAAQTYQPKGSYATAAQLAAKTDRIAYQTVAGVTPTVQLAWETVHQLTDTPTSLTVTMPDAPTDSTVESVLKFTTGDTAPTVTWPSGLLWAHGTPTPVAANATYEFAVSWDAKAAKCTVIGCEFKPTA